MYIVKRLKLIGVTLALCLTLASCEYMANTNPLPAWRMTSMAI